MIYDDRITSPKEFEYESCSIWEHLYERTLITSEFLDLLINLRDRP